MSPEGIQIFSNKRTKKWYELCEKLDHREGELLDALYNKGDIKNVRIVIETMIETPYNQKNKSKEGRLKKLARFS